MRPPKPRLVFRVGVVGHRPDRLKAADLTELSARLGEILSRVRQEVDRFASTHGDMFTHEPPRLRILSPMAEGADRLAAERAIALGYELCCPIPFPLVELEQDFAPESALETSSLDRFRALLEGARTTTGLIVFEMDGDREQPSKAYAASGRVVLNQSDLLVVVWDGQRLGKEGGTEHVLDEAALSGIPMVVVDASHPHEYRVVAGAHPERSAADPRQHGGITIEAVVMDGLELPRADGQVAANRGFAVRQFLNERQRSVNVAPWWKAFSGLVGGGGWTPISPRIRDYEEAVTDEWPRSQSSPHASVVNLLRPFYAWPDGLAIVYADLYRSAFVLTYLLAGLAVGMALVPLAFGWDVYEPHMAEAVFVVGELALIACILLLVWLGRRHGWHQRFLDYRLAAELVRHLRLSAALGAARPFPQVPAQWGSYGDAASTWMSWYVRAVERAIGLPSVRLDAQHLRAATADLVATIRRQLAFHEDNARRSHITELRLHHLGVWLLAATAVACVAHLVFGLGVIHVSPWVLGSLIFLAGFLPAMGAAMAGINNQGEFKRVSMRSQAMAERLRQLDARATRLLANLQSTTRPWVPGASAEVRELATDAAQLMVNEVLDWRVIFLDRPLREP